MKIIFSSIKNNDIFETDFAHLSSQNGTIEFKHMQGSGGIAVIYAPNGTGKTSLANLLDVEVSTEKNSFVASDDQGNTITPETMAFHVIQLIYTTNSIENFNRQLRKVTKSKTIFPTDDSLFKILYLAMTDITKKWTGKTWDWGQTLDQLCIYFGDRIQPEDLE